MYVPKIVPIEESSSSEKMQDGRPQPQHAQSAIATKKRLYAKALDSLTSSSQVSLTPSASTASLKRPVTAAAAFDEARERATKRLRHSTSSTSIRPVVVPSTSTSTAATLQKGDGGSKEPPNFAPWSHEAFLARLKTFSSVSVWHPKPESINEVEWAKRGWVCTDVNTVRCRGGCERRVVVDLESAPKKISGGHDEVTGDDAEEVEDEESAFQRALAERYKDVIVNGHAENCLWRKGGCKDDIYHLQVVRPSIWQPEFQKRMKSALEISGAIENVNMKTIDRTASHFSSPDELLKDLPADLLGDSISALNTDRAVGALEVALHGWRGIKESGAELLQCDACFQRIGLWMYQPDYRPSHSAADDEDSEDDMALDLVELHREHCPWCNPTTQKASGSLSGLNACQILQRVVSTYARDHRRRSDEQAGVQAVEADGEDDADIPAYSKEDVARQDKERESRLRKLKGLFSIKRRSTKTAPKAPAR